MSIVSEKTEALVGGLVVACGLIALVALNQLDSATLRGDTGFVLEAEFNRADGLSVGSPVRLAGIDVGSVTDQTLTGSFNAVVRLRIDRDVALPTDTAAVIATDGLFGGKFIELIPGGALDMLEPGDLIEFTQDSLVIEDLLDRILDMARAKNRAAAGSGAEEEGG